MIKISPMPQHFNVAQPNKDYCCTVRADLSLSVPKKISVSSTISGGASISVWQQTIAGKQETVSKLVPIEEAKKLERIAGLNVNTWLLRTQGRSFEVIISVENNTLKRGSTLHNVNFNIIFVQELI